MIRWYECRIRYRGKIRDAVAIDLLSEYPPYYIVSIPENKYLRFIVGEFKYSSVTKGAKLFKLSPGYPTLEATKAAAESLV